MEDYKKRKRYKRSDFTLDKSGTGVRVPDNSSAALEGALRSFKKNLKEAGKIDEYKNRRTYTKPTSVKRRARIEACRNEQFRWKAQKKLEDGYIWTAIIEDSQGGTAM
tara:strand:+ start:135 stop:458 length:324 start_codon:yes stop_codon:yes gene_type:complete